jgi:hypothetical protein
MPQGGNSVALEDGQEEIYWHSGVCRVYENEKTIASIKERDVKHRATFAYNVFIAGRAE